MIYIPIRFLRAGMVLARDASSGSLFLPLIAAGQSLTVAGIHRLEDCGIAGVYIESSLSADEVPPELLQPQEKSNFLTDIKKVCMQYSDQENNPNTLYRPVSKLASELVTAVLSNDEMLINVIDIRDYDNYTYSHSMFVAMLATMLGARLKLPRLALNDIATAGLMHDIGKLDLPLEIVNKPDKLTAEEFEQMKTHPSNALHRLRTSNSFSLATLLAVESHHERYDGTGYPKGLAGEAIPRYGRILALADVYDALTSNRPYRRAWEPSEVINYMVSCAGTHFDINLLQVFLTMLTAYPVGTVVRLSNGWMAVVTHNVKGQALRPTVCVASPAEEHGRTINLATDRDFLNVTVECTLNNCDELPENLDF